MTQPDILAGGREIKGGSSRNIVAVVVTFNPDADAFDRLLTATCGQVGQILVMDNGSDAGSIAEIERLCAGRATLHLMHANLGIAAAQNRGIALARATAATDVLLLDHDSTPTPDMVDILCAARDRLTTASLCAVGPLVIDRRTQTPAPIPQIINGVVSFIVPLGAAPTQCDYLIASGTLIALSVLDIVGPMNEAYFIDQVDVEWCLRGAAVGLATYCVPSARLHHAIGDDVVRFWAFGWRSMAVHSPARDYYYFRNSVRLILSRHTAAPWRRFWRRRLFRLLVVQCLFIAPRWLRLRAMGAGIAEALREHF
jgi:rhamnosyltransferase